MAPPGLEYYGGPGPLPPPPSSAVGAAAPGGPLGYGMYPPGMPPQDPYYGGYDPQTGYSLPPPPPPGPHMPGGARDFYGVSYPPLPPPGAMMDISGYHGSAYDVRPATAIRPPQPRSQRAAGPPITPPVPRTRRQVSFGMNGEPISDMLSGYQPQSTEVADLLTATEALSDDLPQLAQYHPVPLPGGFLPESTACADGDGGGASGSFSQGCSTLADAMPRAAPQYHHHHENSSDIHVSVKMRHHHHTRTVSYLSETTTATTDLAAGSGVLHFSASHADMTDSPYGTSHSLPLQSPTVSMTHRRHASLSQYTAASSGEPLRHYGGGSSVHHTSLTGAPHQPHSQMHHSATSHPSGPATAAAGGPTGHSAYGRGSVKSGDTTSTTNTAKRVEGQSQTYRWDWRSVTLDIGDDDA